MIGPLLSMTVCALALAAGWYFAHLETRTLRRMIAWRDEEIARLNGEIGKIVARAVSQKLGK